MGSESVDGPVGVTRPGPHTQDLRVAVAMTGGVSLAAWIGGVVRELNLLQQAGWLRDAGGSDGQGGAAGSDDGARMRYLRLISLLDVAPGHHDSGHWTREQRKHWQPKSASRCSPGPSPRPRR
jgi:hypothetical protein